MGFAPDGGAVHKPLFAQQRLDNGQQAIHVSLNRPQTGH
jgi:hypothetical protein